MIKRVIALGYFDGVHRGHQKILREAAAQAKRLGATAAVVTFDNQPRAFLKKRPPNLISSKEQRKGYILAQGIEEVYMLPFDDEMAAMEPEAFVRDILIGTYNCCAVVCGENYTFGAKGRGNREMMTRLGDELGFEVHVCSPVFHEGQTVSSTWIRNLITEGDMKKVYELMGRPYAIMGEVEHGRGVGRRLGFPTGNIALDPLRISPRYGVYAAWMKMGSESYRCALNIGIRPTFGLDTPVAEFNILDFSGDIYGTDIQLDLIEFLRPEQTFASAEELTAQITKDVQRVKEILK
ncbi:MAG: bifunctional riboflavin kinase/FAD synthetase [Clostridia bacterium]|nr:bifunctional riboflavin kinase/FAD synthetase [Clostridia bacterium]MBQ2326600.1 bifunctional riboflavin kinase/FAD synthetase [Clostridia bacterium]